METLKPKDILIVVFHTRQEPWEEIVQRGQFRTWIPEAVNNGFRVAYCFGPIPGKFTKKIDAWNENLRWNKGAAISNFRNHINRIFARSFQNFIPKIRSVPYVGAPKGVEGLEVKISDMYMTARWKQLAIFQYFLEDTEAKFLVIVTSAGYIKPDEMIQKISSISDQVIFAGPFLHKNTPSEFVRGSQLVINRDFARLAIKNRRKIPVEILNDLGLAFASQRLGINAIELPTIDFSSLEEIEEASRDELLNNYHFRLKSFKDGKRNDVELFEKLSERLSEKCLD